MDSEFFSLFNVAEIELTYKSTVKPSERPKIARSQDCFDLLLSFWNKDKIEYIEEFYVVLLNKANKVLGVSRISEGGTSGCLVDPKRVFQVALMSNASSILIAHNHPSGSTQPSEADNRITNKIRSGGMYLDIPVLDHLIVTPSSYYSYADDGVL
jgi:DNA repair protein RadC